MQTMLLQRAQMCMLEGMGTPDRVVIAMNLIVDMVDHQLQRPIVILVVVEVEVVTALAEVVQALPVSVSQVQHLVAEVARRITGVPMAAMAAMVLVELEVPLLLYPMEVSIFFLPQGLTEVLENLAVAVVVVVAEGVMARVHYLEGESALGAHLHILLLSRDLSTAYT